MDEHVTGKHMEIDIELLPPERMCEDDTAICVCCCRKRSRFAMDEDGCGICDECLAP